MIAPPSELWCRVRPYLKRKKKESKNLAQSVKSLLAQVKRAEFEFPQIHIKKPSVVAFAYISTRDHEQVVPWHSIIYQPIHIHEFHIQWETLYLKTEMENNWEKPLTPTSSLHIHVHTHEHTCTHTHTNKNILHTYTQKLKNNKMERASFWQPENQTF